MFLLCRRYVLLATGTAVEFRQHRNSSCAHAVANPRAQLAGDPAPRTSILWELLELLLLLLLPSLSFLVEPIHKLSRRTMGPSCAKIEINRRKCA